MKKANPSRGNSSDNGLGKRGVVWCDWREMRLERMGEVMLNKKSWRQNFSAFTMWQPTNDRISVKKKIKHYFFVCAPSGGYSGSASGWEQVQNYPTHLTMDPGQRVAAIEDRLFFCFFVFSWRRSEALRGANKTHNAFPSLSLEMSHFYQVRSCNHAQLDGEKRALSHRRCWVAWVQSCLTIL